MNIFTFSVFNTSPFNKTLIYRNFHILIIFLHYIKNNRTQNTAGRNRDTCTTSISFMSYFAVIQTLNFNMKSKAINLQHTFIEKCPPSENTTTGTIFPDY